MNSDEMKQTFDKQGSEIDLRIPPASPSSSRRKRSNGERSSKRAISKGSKGTNHFVANAYPAASRGECACSTERIPSEEGVVKCE